MLILEDSLGVASRLKEALQKQGIEVGVATLESVKYSRAADVDLDSLESFQKSLPSLQKPLAALLNLSAMGFSRNCLDSNTADRRRWLEELAVSQFFAARHALEKFETQSPQQCLLLSATCMGGDFGILKDAQYFSGQGAASGFLKSLAKEHPELRVHIADFHPGEDIQTMADFLLSFSHQQTRQDPVEIGLINERRYTQEPSKTPFPATAEAMNLQPDDLLLVSGGARGVTAEIVRELASQGLRRFLLAGRSKYDPESLADIPREKQNARDLKGTLFEKARERGQKPSPRDLESQANRLLAQVEIQDQLEFLKSLGAQAQYISLDVANPEAVQSTLQELQQEQGPIAGYIHGAGILRDKLVAQKTLEQFLSVYRTKTDGLFSVLDALRSNELKLVALFSSVAGKFGNIGQSDYASANEVLNHTALTHSAQWEGCRFLSVNWGPFAGGMVTPELAKMFESRGIGLIPPKAGASLFAREVLFGDPQISEIVVGVGAMELGNPDKPTRFEPLKAQFELDSSKEAWLGDHQLKDKPVIPMAMVLEWCARAAQKLSPSLSHFEIRDLKVLKGVSFEKETIGFEEVIQFQRTESQGLEFTLQYQSNAFSEDFQPAYSARIILSSEAPIVPFAPEPDLNPENRSIRQLYRQYLFHGKTLQCIQSVQGIGAKAMRATLKTSKPVELGLDYPSRWSSDPVVLDGMAQLGLIWLGTHQGCIGIPQGFERYVQLSAFPSPSISCLIQIDELREKAGTASVSVWFLNANDEIVAYGEGWKAIFSESFNAYTTESKEGALNAS